MKQVISMNEASGKIFCFTNKRVYRKNVLHVLGFIKGLDVLCATTRCNGIKQNEKNCGGFNMLNNPSETKRQPAETNGNVKRGNMLNNVSKKTNT